MFGVTLQGSTGCSFKNAEKVWVTVQSGLLYSLGYGAVSITVQSGFCPVWVMVESGLW